MSFCTWTWWETVLVIPITEIVPKNRKAQAPLSIPLATLWTKPLDLMLNKNKHAGTVKISLKDIAFNLVLAYTLWFPLCFAIALIKVVKIEILTLTATFKILMWFVLFFFLIPVRVYQQNRPPCLNCVAPTNGWFLSTHCREVCCFISWTNITVNTGWNNLELLWEFQNSVGCPSIGC